MTHIRLTLKKYDFFMLLGFNSNHEVKKTAYQKWGIPFRAILDRDSRLRLFLTTVSYIFIGRTIFFCLSIPATQHPGFLRVYTFG